MYMNLWSRSLQMGKTDMDSILYRDRLYSGNGSELLFISKTFININNL